MDREVHATAGREAGATVWKQALQEAGATGLRPIDTIQAIENRLYTNWLIALYPAPRFPTRANSMKDGTRRFIVLIPVP